MQFTIPRQQINDAMNTMVKAIDTNPVIPIYETVKIEVSPEQITLTTSNDNISINQTIVPQKGDNAFSDQEIAIAVPARFLAKVIKSFKGKVLTFDIKNKPKVVVVSAGTALVEIPYLEGSEYPKLPTINKATEIAKATISAKKMRQVMKQDIFAASKDQARLVLNGLHLFCDQDQLVSESTDSHRLSRSEIDSAKIDEQFKKIDVILPAETMKRVATLMKDLKDDDKIQIIHFDEMVCFKFANLLVYTKLYVGNYPNTTRLIPTHNDTTLVFDRKEMLNAIKRAILAANTNKNLSATLEMKTPTDKDHQSHTILSTASTADSHTSTVEELPDAKLSGQPLQIAFNPIFVKEALQAFDCNQLKFSFTTSLRPFTVTDPADNHQFVHLVTPVRVL